MAVVATQSRSFENGQWQKQTVGNHDGDIGLEVAKSLLFVGGPQRGRRMYRNAKPFGLALHRRRGQFQSAPTSWTGWLAVDSDDVVAAVGVAMRAGHPRDGISHLTPDDYLIDNASERAVNFILSTARRHHAWAGIRSSS